VPVVEFGAFEGQRNARRRTTIASENFIRGGGRGIDAVGRVLTSTGSPREGISCGCAGLLIGGYRSTPRRRLRPNNSAFVPEWKTRYANGQPARRRRCPEQQERDLFEFRASATRAPHGLQDGERDTEEKTERDLRATSPGSGASRRVFAARDQNNGAFSSPETSVRLVWLLCYWAFLRMRL